MKTPAAFYKQNALESVQNVVHILAAVDLLIEQLTDEIFANRFENAVNRAESLQSIFNRIQKDDLEKVKNQCNKAKPTELANAG